MDEVERNPGPAKEGQRRSIALLTFGGSFSFGNDTLWDTLKECATQ